MQQQLFPADVLQNSTESYLPKVAVKSQWIYTVTVTAIILNLFSLPFLYVDISIQSGGILRTKNEKTELRSLVNGVIRNAKVSENQSVKIDEVLYEINSEELTVRIRLNTDQQKEKTSFINDLEKLVQLDKESLYKEHTFGTSLYAQ